MCVRRGVLCTPPVAHKIIAIYNKRKPFLLSYSHSRITIYDRSTDDGAVGDLPIERLDIECLPTSFAKLMKKKAKMIVRNMFFIYGSTTPTFLGGFCTLSLSLVLIFFGKLVFVLPCSSRRLNNAFVLA